MGAPDLLNHLRASGISVRVEGDKLMVTPASSVTPDVRGHIRTHKTALVALLSKPPERANQSANPLMSFAQSESCHRGGWDDAEISAFTARTVRLQKLGVGNSMAEHLAERLTLRDREHDDRRMCCECANLSDRGRCVAASIGRICRADSRLEPVPFILQRCECYELRKGLA